jgi:predicted CxxxxCH...CXXCH cytochrome family protein
MTRTGHRIASLGATLCIASPLLASACSSERAGPLSSPVFDVDIAPILEAHCVPCHSGPSPAAGWDATSFLGAIACIEPSETPVTLPSSGRAPILSVLSTASHQAFLDAGDQATLQAWVVANAPAFASAVHTPDIIDPRAPGFHGALLRSQHWAQMLNANDPNACGTCHEGTPATPAGIELSAPGAPACTSCHDQPGGALACSTCHGSGSLSFPPRDLCFFPEDAQTAGPHAAHVEPSEARTAGFGCATCHPTPPSNDVISGLHGDGIVEVTFDNSLIGPEASFNSTTGQCSVTCHDSGGLRPKPTWVVTTPMGCNDCHRSPPSNHYPGSCTNCHAEANANGTALTGGPLHLDGQVELGNGNGTCGACHGTGSSPWPSTAAHPSHENPTITLPIACSSCHVVPSSLLAPGHLNGVVSVQFAGLATARGSTPTWNGSTSTCNGVACHGANLPETPAIVPVWTDPSGAAAKCGACHGIPPSSGHTASTDCGRADCHGGEVGETATGVPFITTAGLALHIDGIIESNR